MRYYILCDNKEYGEYKNYKEAREKAEQLVDEFGKYHEYSVNIEYNKGKNPNYKGFVEWCKNNAKKELYINWEHVINCKAFTEKFFYDFNAAYINAHLGIKNAYDIIKSSTFYNNYSGQYCEFLQLYYSCYE